MEKDEKNKNLNDSLYYNRAKSAADLELYSYTQRTKFEYTFAGLIFGTLALSFQLSPKMGNEFTFLLISSWLLLLGAAFRAGQRIYNWIWFERKRVKLYISNQLSSPGFGDRTSQYSEAAGVFLKEHNKTFPHQCWLYFLGLFYNGLWISFIVLINSKTIDHDNPFYHYLLIIWLFIGLILLFDLSNKWKIRRKILRKLPMKTTEIEERYKVW